MKNVGMLLLSGILIITASATSWARDLTATEVRNFRSDLRSLRLKANEHVRTCGNEGELNTVRILQDVSAAAVQLNIRLGNSITTEDQYRNEVATELLPLELSLQNAPDVNACNPSDVLAEIESLTAPIVMMPGPGTR